MNWLLFLTRTEEGYFIEQSGSNIVPDKEYDKVLPTTERIARQADKVFYDGEKLQIKEGKELLSVEQLNDIEQPAFETQNSVAPMIYDIP
ncbi:hypothetical protein [Mammaliicoccus sciuri]|uniref:hypothetical protein n=1 Tax=Mammaliicoccus sciuri TaxID=1296 RepID=UPI003A90D2D4